MKYKALMLDVDGTIVPYDYNAVPSPAVVDAIKKASEKVTVSLVTGREYGFIKHILEVLGMKKGYAVVNNGANVVNIGSEELLYDQPIEKNEADLIIKTLREAKMPFYVKQHYLDTTFISGYFQENQKLENAYMFFVPEEFSEEQIDVVFKKFSSLAHVTFFKSNHSSPDKFGLNITHASATKMHGIEVLMKELGVKREEIIGVGDSYNDFPLLMASGLKVAMGNAIPGLKEVADYIAPSVTEDGVADVIKKFIL
jgi:Cof subfamily protein (haloacid dehalogenase superfamily)